MPCRYLRDHAPRHVQDVERHRPRVVERETDLGRTPGGVRSEALELGGRRGLVAHGDRPGGVDAQLVGAGEPIFVDHDQAVPARRSREVGNRGQVSGELEEDIATAPNSRSAAE